MSRLLVLILAVLFVSGAAVQRNQKPPPRTINTRIGGLEYEADFPPAKAVRKLYDEADF